MNNRLRRDRGRKRIELVILENTNTKFYFCVHFIFDLVADDLDGNFLL